MTDKEWFEPLPDRESPERWLCDHEGDYLEKIDALWEAFTRLRAELTQVKADLDQLKVEGGQAIFLYKRRHEEAEAERDAEMAQKDSAYEERNRCVALLCALLPAVRTRTAIEGWSEDWHGCVYLTLPNGKQASWHYHDSHAHLFAHVPEGEATWDGHTTPEKYERIAACIDAMREGKE